MQIRKEPNTTETLELKELGEYVVLITLNRPEVSNAFNTKMAYDLIKVFEGFATEKTDKRAIVLTGAGNKAFCAGGDLKERKNMLVKNR